jgi:hypothetical protein
MAGCVVCGFSDERALVSTRLARGEVVTVCGTHGLMHERSERKAGSTAELRAMLRDRRESPRRLPIPDELGARLIEAFSTSSERRAGDRRAR